MSWAFAIALVLLLAAGSFFILVGSLGLAGSLWRSGLCTAHWLCKPC